MDGTKFQVCPFCHLLVAPYDEERRKFLGAIAHGACVDRAIADRNQTPIQASARAV